MFVVKKDEIPKTKCERAKTVWTSTQASIHAAKVPGVDDILEIRGEHKLSEEVALQLRGRTQVCGREARETSVKGLFVIILKDKDHYLEVEKVHTRALDQWLNIKSVLMSTMSSTELVSD